MTLAKRLLRRILTVLTFLVWAASAATFTVSMGTAWWLLYAAASLVLVMCAVLVHTFGAYAIGFGWRLDERQREAQQRTYTYGTILTAAGLSFLVGAHAGEAAVTTLPQFAELSFSSGAMVALALLFFSSNVLAFAWLEPDPLERESKARREFEPQEV